MRILFVYTLLKVVSYYDSSVHVSDRFKKIIWMGVGGWGELYPSLFWICFNIAKPLTS